MVGSRYWGSPYKCLLLVFIPSSRESETRRRNEARHHLSGGAGPALLQDGPPFAGQPMSGAML
jgi:hypothetical protein